MTLILAHFTVREQLLVADRKLTDGATGRLINNDAYKLIQFESPSDGYQFAVAFTGLARAGGFETMGWLMDALPKAFPVGGDFNDGLDRFKADCADTFGRIKSENKRIAVIFNGRYHDGRTTAWEPMTLIVSNALEEDGSWSARVNDHFDHRGITRDLKVDPARVHDTRCFGDLRALSFHQKTLARTKRYLRAEISPLAKLELAARFIRTVGRAGSSVGKDVLGIVFPAGGQARAGEWPEHKGRRETLPHYVHASGVRISEISLPPSLGKQLSD